VPAGKQTNWQKPLIPAAKLFDSLSKTVITNLPFVVYGLISTDCTHSSRPDWDKEQPHPLSRPSSLLKLLVHQSASHNYAIISNACEVSSVLLASRTQGAPLLDQTRPPFYLRHRPPFSLEQTMSKIGVYRVSFLLTTKTIASSRIR
jgi:hypothetical protein